MQIQADSLSIQSLNTEFNSEVDEEIFQKQGMHDRLIAPQKSRTDRE